MIQQVNRNIQKDNNRKIMQITNIYLMDKVKIPSVIVECGFLSNPEEEKLLKTAEYQEKTAWAIYMGVMAFLNAG